jgi:hypothetical protein
MKPRHAAALALVGWYLLVPPLVNAPYKIDTEAPLTSWKVYQTFDTHEECDKSLLAAHAKYSTQQRPRSAPSKRERVPSLFR